MERHCGQSVLLLLECLWLDAAVAINTLRLVVLLPVSVSFWFLAWENKSTWDRNPATHRTLPCFCICTASKSELLPFLGRPVVNFPDQVLTKDVLSAHINVNCVFVNRLLNDSLPIVYALNWKKNLVECQWPHSLTEWRPQAAVKLGRNTLPSKWEGYEATWIVVDWIVTCPWMARDGSGIEILQIKIQQKKSFSLVRNQQLDMSMEAIMS